jgi:hypothetical protein
MSTDSVIKLPVTPEEISPEEKMRRVRAVAEGMSHQPTFEWQFWLKDKAAQVGTTPDFLKIAILGFIKDREKAAAEARKIEERAEKEAEKATKSKAKEKAKVITEVAKLPRDERDDRIIELAESCGEDVAAMQQECSAMVLSRVPSDWDVEPWGKPVATAELLQALIDKINKHAVLLPHQAIAVALWVMFAWVHEVAAFFSPYLLITAPDKDSGKTTLGIDVVGKLTPRPFSMAEPNATHIFRVADEFKPTCLCDDVDTIFHRKPELASIFKSGWKRGVKVPRMDPHGFMRHFDPFCPKLCTMIGTAIPEALLSRFVLIKMKPKKSTETIAKAVRDDDEFKDLRRKLLRWSNDNAAALKDAPQATDFSGNREYDNWHLQLAIAALAGDQWRKRALQAAQVLTRTMREPSYRQMLLTEFRAVSKREWITSEEFYTTRITANKLSDWYGYNHGTGVITQRQIAFLLKGIDIFPDAVGPKRLQGYFLKDFADAFDRYRIPEPAGDPLISSDGKKRINKKRVRGKKAKEVMRGSRRVFR